MYRDILTVAKSIYRLTMVLPSVRLACMLGHLSGRMTKLMVDSMGFDGSAFCQRVESAMACGVVLSAVTTTSYLDLRRRGFDVRAVRYEDLVARPLGMCRVILEFCRLPASLVTLAVRAFDVDSQRNCVLARSVIGMFEEPQLTEQTKARLNELLKQYGMPLIGDPGIIEGTLTCQDTDKKFSVLNGL